MRPGIPVFVHDVFHGRRAMPFSEGAVVLRRLTERDTAPFTASRARTPETCLCRAHGPGVGDLRRMCAPRFP